MQRQLQFSFRVNNMERQAIINLATCYRRSQSDAIRYLILSTLAEIEGNNDLPYRPLKIEKNNKHIKLSQLAKPDKI